MSEGRVLKFVKPGGEVRDVSPRPILSAAFATLAGRALPDTRTSLPPRYTWRSNDEAYLTEDGDGLVESYNNFGALPGDGIEMIYSLTVGNIRIMITVALDSIHDVHAFEIAAPPERMNAVVDAVVQAATARGLAALP